MSPISSFDMISIVVCYQSLAVFYVLLHLLLMLLQLILMELKYFFANGLITFSINGNPAFSNGTESLPRNPHDCVILDN